MHPESLSPPRMRIPWEHAGNGRPVSRHDLPPFAGPHVQSLAWRAMFDAVRVRAAFGGRLATFEPCWQMLAKSHKTALSWSLFIGDEAAADAGSERLPDLCVRVGAWDNQRAIRGLSVAVDRQEYLQTEFPLRCATRFLASRQAPVAPLIRRTAQLFSTGLSWESVERLDQGGEWEFDFRDGTNRFRCSYFPAVRGCRMLETLFADWRAWFAAAEGLDEATPDGEVSLEYAESVWEQWDRCR